MPKNVSIDKALKSWLLRAQIKVARDEKSFPKTNDVPWSGWVRPLRLTDDLSKVVMFVPMHFGVEDWYEPEQGFGRGYNKGLYPLDIMKAVMAHRALTVGPMIIRTSGAQILPYPLFREEADAVAIQMTYTENP